MTDTELVDEPPVADTEVAAQRLRRVLRANAATSLAAGLVAALAAPWVVDKAGLDGAAADDWTRAVGAGLVVFAAAVALAASRLAGESLRRAAAVISDADIAWVIATVVVVGTADLNGFGRFIAVAMGIGVLDFALLQIWFRRRMYRRHAPAAALARPRSTATERRINPS